VEDLSAAEVESAVRFEKHRLMPLGCVTAGPDALLLR